MPAHRGDATRGREVRGQASAKPRRRKPRGRCTRCGVVVVLWGLYACVGLVIGEDAGACFGLSCQYVSFRWVIAYCHVFNHALTQRAGRMFFGHGLLLLLW